MRQTRWYSFSFPTTVKGVVIGGPSVMIIPVYMEDFLPLDAHNTCRSQSSGLLSVIGPHPECRLTQTAHILSSLQYILFSSDQDGGFNEGY